jgi:hypothetical protein
MPNCFAGDRVKIQILPAGAWSRSQYAARGGPFLAFKVAWRDRAPSIIGRVWDLISLQSQRRAGLGASASRFSFYPARPDVSEALRKSCAAHDLTAPLSRGH